MYVLPLAFLASPPASPSQSADNPPSFALPTQVQAPAHALPTDEQFYMDGDRTKPDIAFLKNHFYREGRLTEEQALFILRKSVPNPLLLLLPSLLLPSP